MCIVRALLLLSLFHSNRHYTTKMKNEWRKRRKKKPRERLNISINRRIYIHPERCKTSSQIRYTNSNNHLNNRQIMGILWVRLNTKIFFLVSIKEKRTFLFYIKNFYCLISVVDFDKEFIQLCTYRRKRKKKVK